VDPPERQGERTPHRVRSASHALNAAERKLKAERKLGLLATERAKGGQPYQKATSTQRLSVEPTLRQLGVSNKESAEAQLLADW
jgi:hypothetical protein